MNALDLPVGFGFKAQDGQYYGPKGSVGLYHLGNDYYAAMNTPIVLSGIQLGLSGKTGIVAGPHVHVAKWKAGNVAGGYFVAKYNRSYFDPSDVRTITGKVSEIGSESEAGNYVRVQAANGYTYEFFHMNRIDVNVGQVIGEDEMINEAYLDVLANVYFLNRKNSGATADEKKRYIGKADWRRVSDDFLQSKEHQQVVATYNQAGTDAAAKLNAIKEIVG